MNHPLDNIMTYADGEHFDEYHIRRFFEKQMSKSEKKRFLHHATECPNCQKILKPPQKSPLR